MITRRQFVLGSAALATTGMTGALYARFGELHRVEFVDHTLPINALPEDLRGETLVQISDLHIGPRVSDAYLLDTFARVHRAAPAIVVYTGDFITYEGANSPAHMAQLMRSAPRGRLATLAIFGNHDYGHRWRDGDVAHALQQRLQALGIQVLRNTSTEVAGLRVFGFDDLWSPYFGEAEVLARHNMQQPALTLCHNPDACDLPIWNRFRGWILAGHTHGGQVSLPFIGAPLLPVLNKRYVAGAYDLGDGRQLYINRALGHAFPVRVGVRPEVTFHRLAVG